MVSCHCQKSPDHHNHKISKNKATAFWRRWSICGHLHLVCSICLNLWLFLGGELCGIYEKNTQLNAKITTKSLLSRIEIHGLCKGQPKAYAPLKSHFASVTIPLGAPIIFHT